MTPRHRADVSIFQFESEVGRSSPHDRSAAASLQHSQRVIDRNHAYSEVDLAERTSLSQAAVRQSADEHLDCSHSNIFRILWAVPGPAATTQDTLSDRVDRRG